MNLVAGSNLPKVARGDLKVAKGDLKVAKGDLKVARGDLKVAKGDLKVAKGDLIDDAQMTRYGWRLEFVIKTLRYPGTIPKLR